MNLPEWAKSLLARTETLEKRADDEDEAARRQYLFELIGSLFEKANAFLVILQAAGYAGFFAIWDRAHDYMSPRQNLWATFLIGGSLVVFVAWQAIGNILIARQQSGFAKVALAPPHKFKEVADEMRRDGEKLRARLAVCLLPVNIVILASGLAGMALVLWATGRHLLENA